MLNLPMLFEKYEDEYLKFDRITCPRFSSPDLCAFYLLYDLCVVEKGCDIICHAERDEIWLNVNTERLAIVAAEEDILTLIRCGVCFDGCDTLCMFV